VFDRVGNLVDRIGLPAGSRLAGFEHLQRFHLPR